MKRERKAEAVVSALDAAEATSPVEAVESVTRVLGLALDATSVSFLVADLSGRGLVRLAHVPLTEGERRKRGDTACGWRAPGRRGTRDGASLRRGT